VLRADYAYGGSLGVRSLPASEVACVACRCDGSNSLMRVIGWSAIVRHERRFRYVRRANVFEDAPLHGMARPGGRTSRNKAAFR
jgi:hypothetical protein